MLLSARQANWKRGDWKKTRGAEKIQQAGGGEFRGQQAGYDGPAETCCLLWAKPVLQQVCLLVISWSLIPLSCDGLGRFGATKT